MNVKHIFVRIYHSGDNKHKELQKNENGILTQQVSKLSKNNSVAMTHG